MYDKIRYLVLFRPKNMMPFTTGLDTLLVRKVVLHMSFIVIMQVPKLTHMILHR